jgi:7-cyano-7-deazaguanine synthase in queuosine biosynthesis
MKTVTVANIDVDIHSDGIGISCSGGADSSLLLYLLMKHAECPIHIFTCANEYKKYSSINSSINVIKKCIELTDNKNIFHHTHFVEQQTTDNFYLYSHFKLIKILYTAITKNPPVEITSKFKENSTEDWERNPDQHRDLYHRNNSIYTPFHRVDKKSIAEMYKELNLLDTLFPLTRSCENIMLTEGHCGECWWCEERLWGFGRLT